MPRRLGAAALASAALALGACGDDDDDSAQDTAATDTTATETAPATTPRERTETVEKGPAHTDPVPDSGGTGGASPENEPGGAGDEEPARSQALFTGRNGRISPSVVRVPPFIAIRVELRSADGAAYRLQARGRTLSTDADVASASTRFAGLRPGKRLVLKGPKGTVVVEASAEPGP